MISTSALKAWITAAAVIVLTACGGGGGSEPPPSTPNPIPNPPAQVTAPAITSQPQSQTINDGQSAAFSVTATGTAPLTYQWKRNGVDVTGATTNQYSISAAALVDHGAQFQVTVTNSAGTATSNQASLSVNAIAPGIDTQPVAQSVLAGATATFSVSASGSQPLSYQWRRNGVAIPGANSNTYITASNAVGDSGALFDVLVSNAAGNVASSAVLLTVSVVTTPPTISKQPQSASTQVGGAVAFSVTATGTAPFTYQWKRNGAIIPNATTQILIIAPVSSINHQDKYSVLVENTGGVTESSEALLSVSSQAGQIDLVAGLYGGRGNVDGTGGNAHFNYPRDVAADTSGNLFVADPGTRTVRKVTPAGVVTTVAGRTGEMGHADGDAHTATFGDVNSVAVDTAGNVFVTDGYSIRKIAPNGMVSTLAGDPEQSGYATGSGSSVRFDWYAFPGRGQVAVAPNGEIYVGDCNNHVIRAISPTGVVTNYSGTPNQAGSADGSIAAATFNCPASIAFDAQGNMYVADSGNHTLRKITAGMVSTLAASFQYMTDIAVDSGGNIFVLDSRAMRKVTPAGVVTTVVGNITGSSYDGAGTAAGLFSGEGITVDAADTLYVAETSTSYAIRRITPDFTVTTFPSRLGQDGYRGYEDGPAATALFNGPVGVTGDATGNIYVADAFNCSIRKISPSSFVTSLVGEPEEGLGACSSSPVISGSKGISAELDGTVYVGDSSAVIHQVSPSGVVSNLAGSYFNYGHQDGIGPAARFSTTTGIASDGNGNVYVVDRDTIRKIVVASRTVSTLAGNPQAAPGSQDGVGPAARFNGPCGIEADRNGNVYVADCANQTIRKVTPSGVVTTIAGVPGLAGYVDGDTSAALFNSPADVALDDNGNLYVADQGNFLIRKITPSGVVSTVAGVKGLEGQSLGPLPASLNVPIGIHARSLPVGTVELTITIDHAVVRVLTN